MPKLPPMIAIEVEPDRESQEAPPVPGSAIDILARTLWGEARGEPVRGIEAVAAVIINRVTRARSLNGRYWWGHSVETVCQKPWQFSCWNESDPNCQKVTSVDMANRQFRTCVRIARRAIGGAITDPTNGATHYHRVGMLPAWARQATPSAEIGHHLFYNDVE